MASKRFNALMITGLTTAVLAGIPALSSAKNYTGKTPAVAIDSMPVIPPAGMSTVTTTTAKKHKVTSTKTAKKLSSVSKKSKKVKKLKKHKLTAAKKTKA